MFGADGQPSTSRGERLIRAEHHVPPHRFSIFVGEADMQVAGAVRHTAYRVMDVAREGLPHTPALDDGRIGEVEDLLLALGALTEEYMNELTPIVTRCHLRLDRLVHRMCGRPLDPVVV